MEPCWWATKPPVKRTLLRRPFPVRPFLSNYATNELSQFMRANLDAPFNARFSKFIEVVNMTGADFVRLSKKDLARLCDGEGPYLYDLTTFQEALRPPSSPHVRDIFPLPEVRDGLQSEEKPPEIVVPEVEFDWGDDDDDEDLAADAHLAAHETHQGDASNPNSQETGPSRIDMSSPLPLSIHFDSDGYLSPESDGSIHEVFDSPHLNSLCSPLDSPCFSDDMDVDDLDLERKDMVALPSDDAQSAPSPTYQISVAEKYWSDDLRSLPPYSPSAPHSTYDTISISAGNETHISALEAPTPAEPTARDAYAPPLASSRGDPAEDLDTNPETQWDGAGLSVLMPDLRSLDSSLPSSPLFDSPYTLSQIFSDASVLSGGSLGLSLSPDLSIIRTPTSAPFAPADDDVVVVVSPSTSYRIPDTENDLAPSKKWREHGGAQFANSSTARRPKIEVTIPNLPSLLEDAHLWSLMSTIELSRAPLSYEGRPSSFDPSPPSGTWTSASLHLHHDRSIWPVSTTAERYLPSPYMKNDPHSYSGTTAPKSSPKRRKRVDSGPPAAGPQVVGRSKSAGTVSEHPTEAVGVFTVHDAAESPSRRHIFFKKGVVTGNAGPQAGLVTSVGAPWCKVSEYIWTILTPIEAEVEAEVGDGKEEGRSREPPLDAVV